MTLAGFYPHKLFEHIDGQGIDKFFLIDGDVAGPGPATDPTLGGELSGTASAAVIVTGAITDSKIAAALKDPLPGTYGLRTLGTGAQQAAAGNDSRLSDTRTPTDGTVTEPKFGPGKIFDLSKFKVPPGTPVGYFIGTDGTQWLAVAPPSGGGDPTMGGDLSGVASAAQIIAGAITNAEINASAGIALSKLAAGTEGFFAKVVGGVPTWVSVAPGGTSVPWMLVATDNGAVADAKTSQAGCTIAASSNVAVVSDANFTNAHIGKKFTFLDGSTRRVRQIVSRDAVDPTHKITFDGTAVVTGCTNGPAAWGTDNTAALTSAASTAGSSQSSTRRIVGYPPGAYLVTGTVDWTPQGVWHLGLGARTHMATDAGFSQAGAIILAAAETASVCLDADRFSLGTPAGTGSITHNGLRIENLAVADPLRKHSHTLLRIGCMTRHRVDNCGFFQGNIGIEYRSGTKDVSWGLTFWSDFTDNNTGLKTTNSVLGSLGAMAHEVVGGNFNVSTNQKGIWHRGGQYFRCGDFKMDIDGNGSRGVVFDDSAYGSSPGTSVIWNMVVEHTSDTMDNTHRTIEVRAGQATDAGGTGGGVGNVLIIGCLLGGGTGGGPGHGTAVHLEGTASNKSVTSCEIVNSSFQNYDTGVYFGAYSQRCSVRNTSLTGMTSYYIDVAANAVRPRASNMDFDGVTNPLLGAKIRYAAGTQFYMHEYMWDGGACNIPNFGAAPPADFGAVGDVALFGAQLYVKTGASTWSTNT